MGEWSFKVGRIFGIQIRLHLFFVMGVAFILLRGHQNGDFTNALFWCFSLYVTVLLHELGHCWAGIRNDTGRQQDEDDDAGGSNHRCVRDMEWHYVGISIGAKSIASQAVR